MDRLVEDILHRIETAQKLEDLDGWIWKAGDLLAKVSYKEFQSGFAEIDRITVRPEEAEMIKKGLLSALDRNQEPRFVQQILGSLMMSHDPDLKPLFVSYLHQSLTQLKTWNALLSSALNGLSRVDENVYEGGSQSVADVDKTIRQADRYLQKLGKTAPW